MHTLRENTNFMCRIQALFFKSLITCCWTHFSNTLHFSFHLGCRWSWC